MPYCIHQVNSAPPRRVIGMIRLGGAETAELTHVRPEATIGRKWLRACCMTTQYLWAVSSPRPVYPRRQHRLPSIGLQRLCVVPKPDVSVILTWR